MIVRDIMSKNIVSVMPDETVSQALSKMKKNALSQLPVIAGKELYGIVELRKIVTKDADPSMTKISGFVTHVPSIDPNASVESLAELLLRSGMRAIPVVETGEVIGVVSESDTLKAADMLVMGLDVKSKDIISPAEYVDKSANMGKIRKIMLEKNISRVPVVEGEKVIGIVSTMEMARLLGGKEKMQSMSSKGRERSSKEKIRLDDTAVETLMRQPVVVSGEKNIRDIVDLLKTNEEVVVTYENGIGIITPKDVLELFTATPKKQVFVQITGMQNESIEFKIKMDSAVNEFVQKAGKKINNIEFLFLHVDKIHKGSKHELYFIRARFKVPFGLFVAKAEGWRPLDVIQDVIGNLEREVFKKQGKIEDNRRMKRQKNRYP